jgi:hypothetical protein
MRSALRATTSADPVNLVQADGDDRASGVRVGRAVTSKEPSSVPEKAFLIVALRAQVAGPIRRESATDLAQVLMVNTGAGAGLTYGDKPELVVEERRRPSSE